MQFVKANTLNYSAAAVFFAAAIRDWFFPGVFQMARHPMPSDEGVVWFIMGCTCVVAGLTRSRGAKKAL
jgi:hypothetical protein